MRTLYQETEYNKCKSDYIYAIEKYLQVYSLHDRKFVPLKLFEKQKRVFKDLTTFRFNSINKSRQVGGTTLIMAWLACEIIFADVDKPEKVLLVANKGGQCQELLKKLKTFLSQFPIDFWDNYNFKKIEGNNGFFKKSTSRHLQTVNGCEVRTSTSKINPLCSFAPTKVFFDESAYILDARMLHDASVASLCEGGSITLISTPNGKDDLHYKIYSDTLENKSCYNVVEIKWYEDERFNKDLEWVKTIDGVEERIKETNNSDIIGFEAKIKVGYIPTSPWYYEMCRCFNFDRSIIERELDAKFNCNC